jgi:hypothetical protein
MDSMDVDVAAALELDFTDIVSSHFLYCTIPIYTCIIVNISSYLIRLILHTQLRVVGQ